jgi:hypothetical protein
VTYPPLPLTDDQLRQIAAHYAVEAVRDRADDTMGHLEGLDAALAQLDINTFDPDTLTNDLADAIAERIGDLLDTATITVAWPDADPIEAVADAHSLSLDPVDLSDMRATCTCGWVAVERSERFAFAAHAAHVHVAAGLATEDDA